MDVLVDITKNVVEFLFRGYTTKQKRDNIRFLHGIILFCMVLLFIFSPSRSWARWIVMGCFSIFITLYITLGDCWISVVENEYGGTEDLDDNDGVLIPILNLTGHPITSETKTLVASIAYIYTVGLMVSFTIRDCFGVY